MGVHVLVVYRPKPGEQAALEAEVAAHVPTLRSLGLATSAPATALRASDGSVVEHFEWRDRSAIESAHTNPEVLAMWERFERCSTYGTLADLANAAAPFAEFELVGSF